MRVSLAMLRPDRGTAALRVTTGPEVDVRAAPAGTWAHVGHLIETPLTYTELTVTETVQAAARLRGRPRPHNDTWIAACCLAYDLPLATLNVKDFKDFAEHEGLTLIGAKSPTPRRRSPPRTGRPRVAKN
jgi:ABC-type multidrug transport system ATPase subunit